MDKPNAIKKEPWMHFSIGDKELMVYMLMVSPSLQDLHVNMCGLGVTNYFVT